MEGGQNFNIPLDSSLDVHHSDMLVPVNQPTFLHNRQKYQGKFMPSSLRYEHDGWAAGWDVYQFKFSSVSVPSIPAGYTVKRYSLDENFGQYTFAILDSEEQEVAHIYYTRSSRVLNGNVVLTDLASTSTVTGNVNGKEYVVEFNPVNRSVSILYGTGIEVDLKDSGSGIYVLSVYDKENEFVVDIDDFVTGSDITASEGNIFAYYRGYENGIHTWESETHVVTFNEVNQSLLIDNNPPESISIDGANISFVANTTADSLMNVTFMSESFCPLLEQISAETSTPSITGMEGAIVNRWGVNGCSSSYVYSGNYSDIEGWFPVWAGFRIEVKDHGFDFHAFEHDREVEGFVHMEATSLHSVRLRCTADSHSWLGGLTLVAEVNTATLEIGDAYIEGQISGGNSARRYVLASYAVRPNKNAYCWAVCLRGHFNVRMSMEDKLTMDNADSKVHFAISPNADDKLYIDRDGVYNRRLVTLNDKPDLVLILSKFSYAQLQFTALCDFFTAQGNNTNYIPGHIYTGDLGNKGDSSGNLSATTNINAVLKINFMPSEINYVTDCTAFWSKVKGEGAVKEVLSDWSALAVTANIMEPVITVNNGVLHAEQPITISSGGVSGTFVLSHVPQSMSFSAPSITVAGCPATVKVNNPILKGSNDIVISVAAKYSCKTSRAYTEDDNLIEYKNNTASFLHSNKIFKFYKLEKIARYDSKAYPTDTVGDANIIKFTATPVDESKLLFRGPFETFDTTVNNLDSNTLSFVVDDKAYSVNLVALLDMSRKTTMDFYYTDTRDREVKDVLFASKETDTEFQFVKQQWDTTVETENFWWVDSQHILCLTKTAFQLKRKLATLHDWNGDNWEIVSTWNRDSILPSGTYAFGATSSYNNAPVYLWRVSVDNGQMLITFYNPLAGMAKFSVSIEKRRHALGTVLNSGAANALNTYSDIQISTLASMSKYTSSSVGNGDIVFGIHFDKNYNQWGVIINVYSGVRIIVQGYGYVGVNGCLTGGEIPSKWFSASKGFIGAVEDIREFSRNLDSKEITTFGTVEDLYQISDRVVGNESIQWYVTKNISGIVSHLEYANGSFRAVELPLNNNYDVVYASPSCSTRSVSDFMPTIKSPVELFPLGTSLRDSAIKTIFNLILAACGMPMLYLFSIRFNTLIYLQQTLGQYAFVHYNSTIKPVKDTTQHNDSFDADKTAGQLGHSDYQYKNEAFVKPTSVDELSFDTVTVKQEASVEKNPWNLLPGLILQFFISALNWHVESLQVNNKIAQNDTTEEGKKFSIVLSHNIDFMGLSDMVIKSATPSAVSGVTATKTLDMFYSTSDKQNVNAGPGYVSHAFVAQCVAQSITSCQLEMSQLSAFYVIKELTKWQLDKEIQLLTALKNFIHNNGETWKNQLPPTVQGTHTGDIILKVVATALFLAEKALELEITAIRSAEEAVVSILTAVGGDRLHTEISAVASKHLYDMEGKHKYGSKSECFMWPCFGCEENATIKDEYVNAVVKDFGWEIKVPIGREADVHRLININVLNDQNIASTTTKPNKAAAIGWWGELPYYVANCRGDSSEKILPSDTAYVLGTESFLSREAFRNENISESEPVFPVPVIQDYVIDKSWQLGQTCIGDNGVFWLSCKDTKLIDCPPSNIVVSPGFCGVACSYTAIEVKRGISRKYLRPWAVTPQALALNNTGFNSCYEEKAYHSFDGYGYRLVNWIGASGMNKEHQTWQYSYLINDRFKRSNKLDCNQFLGNFKSDPTIAIKGDVNDKVYCLITQPTEGRGLESGSPEEDKDVIRYALPVFSEFVSTLPAVVKTLSSYQLSVVDGITSLASDLRNGQANYKVPVSIDFSIGKNLYRVTSEYICSLQNQNGLVIPQELVPTLGLTFLGATPYEAYFYSQATRQYYKYTGGTSLNVVDMIERFRNVTCGRYDFVNQEVVIPCLATFNRLDNCVEDDTDETDNVLVPRIKESDMKGEIWPPINTIFNTRSWYRTISLPCGVTYQGPNRCIINRFTFSDYMKDSIIANYGNWKRVPREVYHPFREYKAKYEQVDKDIGIEVRVKGWTHNPFLLVTSPYGSASETDNLYEWEITFAWPVEMDELYGINDYAVVNIAAETMTPGGKVFTRPTHVFLTKELFTRTGNYGYYSFRYQSKGGAGNRERLHIWSDQYIAISSIQCTMKPITQKRTEILTQQLDVQRLNEI